MVLAKDYFWQRQKSVQNHSLYFAMVLVQIITQYKLMQLPDTIETTIAKTTTAVTSSGYTYLNVSFNIV
jgi:hypothetical protein